MTTIAFAPSSTGAPPFQAAVTLDGNGYTLIASWNFYRSGWYVSLVDQSGNIVANQPLIESPVGSTIALFPGQFTTSSVVYAESTSQFVITP